jgi:hypothetical protein
MTIIKDIHAYLKDQDIENLFRSKAPIDYGDCTWIVESPSPPPNTAIGYFEQNLDFWARYRKTDDARSALESIQEILHRKVSFDTDSFHVYLSVINGLITDMGQDSENRNLFLLNLRFIYRPIE